MYGKFKDLNLFKPNNIDIQSWLAHGLGFSYVKVLYKVITQYSYTGKVFYSNAELSEITGYAERTIQWALERLEESGYCKRTFADENRTKRTGIELYEEAIISLMGLRPKEIARLDRGNAAKHIRSQMPVYFKSSEVKKLSKRIASEKDQKKRQALIEQLNAINSMYREYDEYVDKIVARNESYISEQENNPEVDHNSIVSLLREVLPSWGVNIPAELSMN